eukprot:5063077-Pleurochrysis_carterae.AAC.1
MRERELDCDLQPEQPLKLFTLPPPRDDAKPYSVRSTTTYDNNEMENHNVKNRTSARVQYHLHTIHPVRAYTGLFDIHPSLYPCVLLLSCESFGRLRAVRNEMHTRAYRSMRIQCSCTRKRVHVSECLYHIMLAHSNDKSTGSAHMNAQACHLLVTRRVQLHVLTYVWIYTHAQEASCDLNAACAPVRFADRWRQCVSQNTCS